MEMRAHMAQNKAEQTRKFLQLMFQDYYRANPTVVDIPERIHMREFGIERWSFTWRCIEKLIVDESGNQKREGCGESGRAFSRIKQCPNCGSSEVQANNWSRHVGFRSRDALLNELVVSAPHSVYHSAAFYTVPVARHMDEKGWQGAELVFDIDADHLDSPCVNDHDTWKCNNVECLEIGRGPYPPMGCPKCGGMSFSSRKWVCESCLSDAKENTLKVYDDFLVSDFGIDPAFIQLNYSGHRGYHLRVRDPRIFKMDSSGRIEIIHYISGMGLTSGIAERSSLKVVPNRELPGWAGKISDAMIEFIRKIDSYEGTERWVKQLKTHQTAAIEGLLRNPPVLSSRVKSVGVKSWQEIAVRAAAAYGGDIDVPVTHDIHRVIRLIGSLSGKTGFTVTALTRDEIEEFDPFADTLAFTEGTLKVRLPVSSIPIPSFRIGDEKYGPFQGDTLDLPMSVAVFLLCKGVVTIE
jgi:DNA primase small subunit